VVHPVAILSIVISGNPSPLVGFRALELEPLRWVRPVRNVYRLIYRAFMRRSSALGDLQMHNQSRFRCAIADQGLSALSCLSDVMAARPRFNRRSIIVTAIANGRRVPHSRTTSRHQSGDDDGRKQATIILGQAIAAALRFTRAWGSDASL